MSNVKNKRILLKLSGEALKCGKDDIYDSEFVDKVAELRKILENNWRKGKNSKDK